jgi:hypothetical protein
MTKNPYNFGHVYELNQLKQETRYWAKQNIKAIRRLKKLTKQVILKKVTINTIKTKLETLGIH